MDVWLCYVCACVYAELDMLPFVIGMYSIHVHVFVGVSLLLPKTLYWHFLLLSKGVSGYCFLFRLWQVNVAACFLYKLPDLEAFRV